MWNRHWLIIADLMVCVYVVCSCYNIIMGYAVLCSWTTLGWPRKIQDQSENCIKQLDQDEERFQKNLTNDQSTFEDRLDSLEVKISGVSAVLVSCNHFLYNIFMYFCIYTYLYLCVCACAHACVRMHV